MSDIEQRLREAGERLAMEIAVEMELHAAISTTTKAKAEAIAKFLAPAFASLRSKLEEAEGARGSALVATPPAGGDDWTVDDTLTAREILDYLGIGSDASLEPYADRRRDAVAKIIQKRIATTPPAEPVVEEWREIEQHVQPRLADGYTAVAISKPGFWMVKGPGPASALATKPAVKDDETVVEAQIRDLVNLADRSPLLPIGDNNTLMKGCRDALRQARALGDPNDTAIVLLVLRAALATKPAVKDDETVVEALRKEADSAYCRFLDKMSAPLCLGVEHKLETGKFGAAELNAHVDARELYGFHRGINHALSALAAKDGRS